MAPNDPIYRLAGISRSIVGVEVPEAGVDRFDTSDSVRLRVFMMVGCVGGRGWKIEAGF